MTSKHHKKVIGRRDVVLFCISAILLLDTVAAGAAVGASSIFWWVILGVFFYVPFSLISVEMGSTYPDQGGIYAWVDRAFGSRWASSVAWSYWINMAIWCPAIHILFAGIFSQIFDLNLSLYEQIAIGIGITWLTVLVNVITLDIGKWVPNIGAILKVIVFMSIIIGAYFYYQDHGMANELTAETLTPHLGEGLKYLPVIIYGMLGFELICAGADEMENPQKDLPIGVLISGIIIIVLYILATFAVLTAIPAADINLVEGLVDTLNLFFGASQLGRAFVLVLAIGTLYTFFSNGVTWALGANRAAAEAAREGELPALFAYESKVKRTPIGAALALGVVSTSVLILYGLIANSNEDLFWSLFAFSSVIFLAPYVVMMLAYIKLRNTDTDTPRPFKIAGANWVGNGLALLCSFILILAIILFVYVPGEGEGTGMQWSVFYGATAMLLLGEVLIHLRRRSGKS